MKIHVTTLGEMQGGMTALMVHDSSALGWIFYSDKQEPILEVVEASKIARLALMAKYFEGNGPSHNFS